jgi:pimeloyl-ACP methyl ester carboxylesterase
MIAVANAGYRAIAFDSRGYGLSDHPAEPEKATSMDLVHEAKDLLDSLGISKVRIKIFINDVVALMRQHFMSINIQCGQISDATLLVEKKLR